jgi:hypothetical protein
MPHERDPQSLAKETWFYSLPRRSQSATLRRATIVLFAVAVVLILAATIQLVLAAGAVAAIAGVVTLEVAGYLRGRRQRRDILVQLAEGTNPQLLDAVGASLPNRLVIPQLA